MDAVSIAEAREKLPEILANLNGAPVLVMDEGKVVGMISSPEAAEQEQQAAWRRFLAKRDAVAAEFEENLAKDGLTVDEFLADVLSAVS
jgi:PHD/YefM family antitoxin component YafN of YafNO toxin-antitoxin module